MRISTKFSDAIHLLAFIKVYQSIKLTSIVIAASINTSPVVVRRLMGELKTANLIARNAQTKNPVLVKEAKDISLLDIYLVTDGHAPLFAIDKDTNPLCIVGGNIQQVLTDIYGQAERAALVELNHHTMQEVIDNLLLTEKLKKSPQRNEFQSNVETDLNDIDADNVHSVTSPNKLFDDLNHD